VALRRHNTEMPITQEELLAPVEGITRHDRLQLSMQSAALEEFSLRLYREDGELPSSASRRQFTDRFPEIREVAGKFGCQWIATATDVTATIIRELWPQDQLVLDEESAIVYSHLQLTLAAQSASARRTAEYREFMTYADDVIACAAPTPRIVESYPLQNGWSPMLHQQVAYANSLHTDGYGLFMEQGTGKTAVVIGRVDHEAVELKRRTGRLYRTIIVAPKNVRANWRSEFARFSTQKGRVTVLRGGKLERTKLLLEALVPRSDAEQYAVVVCSYESLVNTWELIGSVEWDLAVLDESHYIKGWTYAKRPKQVLRLRDVSRQRMCLTGTPVCNNVADLYPQLEFLGRGYSGFKSFDAFRKFYGMYQAKGPRGVRRLIDVQNLPFMRERLARNAFIVRKEEALPDLPTKMYDMLEVEMTTEQRRVYETVRDQLFAEIDEMMERSELEGRTINPQNILVKLLRLAQITSGFMVFDPIVDDWGEELAPKRIERFEENPKLDALIELLKDTEPDEKIIVWAAFIDDIEAITERVEAEGLESVQFYGATSDIDRAEAERRYNCDPSCRVFIGNPGAGGTGLNLIGYPPGEGDDYVTNTTHVVYYSQDWSHPKRSQSEDRAHRRGTRVPVQITDLCIPDTIDEEIRARVTNKRSMALEVQDLRSVLTRVLGRSF
jgi:SNF2 family DNA or RNA helicase